MKNKKKIKNTLSLGCAEKSKKMFYLVVDFASQNPSLMYTMFARFCR